MFLLRTTDSRIAALPVKCSFTYALCGTLLLVEFFAFSGRTSLQPNLSPVRINAPRAKHAATTVSRLTYYVVENDTRIFYVQHPSGLFVDNVRDSFEDAVRASTIGHHFSVPPKPAVLASRAERTKNVLMRFHAN